MASGLRCQPLAESAVELSATTDVATGLVTADAFLHTTRDDAALRAATQAHGRRPGARRARIVTSLADGRIESPGESLFRWLTHRHGVALTPTGRIA